MRSVTLINYTKLIIWKFANVFCDYFLKNFSRYMSKPSVEGYRHTPYLNNNNHNNKKGGIVPPHLTGIFGA